MLCGIFVYIQPGLYDLASSSIKITSSSGLQTPEQSRLLRGRELQLVCTRWTVILDIKDPHLNPPAALWQRVINTSANH